MRSSLVSSFYAEQVPRATLLSNTSLRCLRVLGTLITTVKGINELLRSCLTLNPLIFNLKFMLLSRTNFTYGQTLETAATAIQEASGPTFVGVSLGLMYVPHGSSLSLTWIV